MVRWPPLSLVIAALGMVIALGACTMPVPTARGNGDYGRKAATTAQSVRSAVETARLADLGGVSLTLKSVDDSAA